MPALAVSLAVLGKCQEGLGRTEEALNAIFEAITALGEPFLRQPEAYAHWMGPMIGQYLHCSARLRLEPNAQILSPLVEAYRKWQSQEKPE